MPITLEQIRVTLGCKATVVLNGKDFDIGRVIETPRGDGRARFSVAHRTEIVGNQKLGYVNLYPSSVREMIHDGGEVIFDLPGIGGGIYNDRFPERVPQVDAYLKEIGL